MALDVMKLLEYRAGKEGQPDRRSRKQRNALQIRMFEEIEDGTACRCPACMGRSLRVPEWNFSERELQTNENNPDAGVSLEPHQEI